MPSGGFVVGIDLGTSNTVAVIRSPDGRRRPVLFDGAPLMPSAVFMQDNGQLAVGRDAQRLAQLDPGRYEPNPKRRVDEHSVLLGSVEVPTVQLLAAVLRSVAAGVSEITRFAPPAVLTYPASWGQTRRTLLHDAAVAAGFPQISMVPEPVAAARYFISALNHPLPRGSAMVVYDFGGGTIDIAVVRNEEQGFTVIGSGGLEDVGGLDIDAALVDLLGDVLRTSEPATWQRLEQPLTAQDRRDRRLFWEDIRGAKEMLSRTAVAPVSVPGVEAALHLTREELERKIGPMIRRTVSETARVVQQCHLKTDQLSGIMLVGGSSRVPLVARMLHRELQVVPTVLEQPELPVAEGAVVHPAELGADGRFGVATGSASVAGAYGGGGYQVPSGYGAPPVSGTPFQVSPQGYPAGQQGYPTGAQGYQPPGYPAPGYQGPQAPQGFSPPPGQSASPQGFPGQGAPPHGHSAQGTPAQGIPTQRVPGQGTPGMPGHGTPPPVGQVSAPPAGQTSPASGQPSPPADDASVDSGAGMPLWGTRTFDPVPVDNAQPMSAPPTSGPPPAAASDPWPTSGAPSSGAPVSGGYVSPSHSAIPGASAYAPPTQIVPTPTQGGPGQTPPGGIPYATPPRPGPNVYDTAASAPPVTEPTYPGHPGTGSAAPVSGAPTATPPGSYPPGYGPSSAPVSSAAASVAPVSAVPVSGSPMSGVPISSVPVSPASAMASSPVSPAAAPETPPMYGASPTQGATTQGSTATHGSAGQTSAAAQAGQGAAGAQAAQGPAGTHAAQGSVAALGSEAAQGSIAAHSMGAPQVAGATSTAAAPTTEAAPSATAAHGSVAPVATPAKPDVEAPPRPGKGRRNALIAGLVALLVLVGGGVWALTAFREGDTEASNEPEPIGKWEELPDVPTEVDGQQVGIEAAGAAVVGTNLYVIGGLSAEGKRPKLSSVWVYDISQGTSGTWQKGPELPLPLSHMGVVVDGNDALWVLGGWTVDGASDRVFQLSSDGQDWDEKASLPEARNSGAAVFDGTDVIYAGGTAKDGNPTDTIWALNKDGDGWEDIGHLKRAREKLTAVSDGTGTTLFLGGQFQNNNNETYDDIDELSHRQLKDTDLKLDHPREGAAGVNIQGIGRCVLGGTNGHDEIYDWWCEDDSQTAKLPKLAKPRAGVAAAVAGASLYVIGGYSPTEHLDGTNTVERFTPDN